MTTLGVRQVVSEQAGNPDIYRAFARSSFLHRFRDQVRPGRHNFRFVRYTCFYHAMSGLYEKL